MAKQSNWWEPIFSGELEIGLNKEKLEEMDHEGFLYFDETQPEAESHL
ncbi:hypothetical protein [Planococcus salinus]|nr:hypothetical protein [Planococcus salinus]